MVIRSLLPVFYLTTLLLKKKNRQKTRLITQARELLDISLRAATYEPNVQLSFKNDGAKIDASLIFSHTGMSMLIVSPAEHADDGKDARYATTRV